MKRDNINKFCLLVSDEGMYYVLCTTGLNFIFPQCSKAEISTPTAIRKTFGRNYQII